MNKTQIKEAQEILEAIHTEAAPLWDKFLKIVSMDTAVRLSTLVMILEKRS